MKGVLFGNIHSYRDLNLILEPFTPTPAEPQTNFLQVPGRDGYLDLTEANGEVKFKSRVFSIPFTIAPGDDLTFDERVSMVSGALNGLKCNIIFDRDPNYYWAGRLMVDKYAQNKNIGKIVVKATVEPYKLNHVETVRYMMASSSPVEMEIISESRMPVIPTVTCANDAVIVFGGVTYTLKAGTHKIPGIRFVEGINIVTISGKGPINFKWWGGAL